MILTEWQKEDLEDLQENYPNLDEMTDEEFRQMQSIGGINVHNDFLQKLLSSYYHLPK